MSDQMEQAPEQGQATESSAPDMDEARAQAQADISGQAAQTPDQPSSPFLEFEAGDQKISFSNADEARNAFKNGYLMQNQFTKKTQSLAEERKKWEQERETQLSELNKTKERIDKYNEFLNQNPHIVAQLERMKNQPLGNSDQAKIAQTYTEQALSPVQKELEELKQWRQQQETEARREQALSSLASSVKGFDRKNVEQMMQEFDPSKMEDIYRLLHYAHMGKNPPAPGNEVLMAKRQQERSQARMGPNPGAMRQEPGAYADMDEARMAAMKDHGLA